MTTVTYFEQDDEISIEISGHSGYGTPGSDIVCSAISMLAQTLLAYLNVDNDKYDYSMRDGLVWAYAKGKNVRTAMSVIMAGYYLLARDYPDYVRIDRGCSIQRTP